MASAAIACSDPRAARAGADILEAGGNAVDAAVAAAFVLFVVEPQSCGPGGDAFLIVSEPGKEPEGLDGSGAVPTGLTQEALQADGLDFVPIRGARTVTVPGAIGLLEEALRLYGTRSIADLVGPAVVLARDGYAARRTLAETASRASGEISKDPVLGPLYAPGGTPIRIDAMVKNPRLGALLGLIAREGAEVFYRGPVAEQIVARVREGGGYLSLEDMQAHRTVPARLLSTQFRGARVYEMPAPTQGPAVIAALDLIEPMRPIEWEKVLEAIIAGMKEAGIDLHSRPAPQPASAAPRDTTYIAAIDREGRGASLITSVFADFGSYVGVDILGGPIHNRATTFYAQRLPPRPGKPPHTTIPGLVTRDGRCEYVLGLAGGYVQAQVQVQLLIHLLDEGLEPQPAIDAPRMRVQFGAQLGLEPGHPLAERFPEAVEEQAGPEGYGAAQIASRRDGAVRAGADRRRDGVAIELS